MKITLPKCAPLIWDLMTRLEDIEFSVRPHGVFRDNNITYVRDLLRLTEEELLRLPNFGYKSLKEVRDVLANRGLHLQMQISDEDNATCERVGEIVSDWLRHRLAYGSVSNEQLRKDADAAGIPWGCVHFAGERIGMYESYKPKTFIPGHWAWDLPKRDQEEVGHGNIAAE